MESKYYTPEISEFHVGFECEERHKDEFGTWMNYSSVVINRHEFVYLFQFPDKWLPRFRVKYLDKEDIESTGFMFKKNGSTISDNNPDHFNMEFETNYHTLTYLNWFVGSKVSNKVEWEELRMVLITSKGEEGKELSMFRGDIKNKSELVKVLRQLRIIE